MKKTTRYLILGVSLFLFLACSGWMYYLHNNQQLWGYLPIPQFLSLLGIVLMLWYPRFSKLGRKDYLLGLSLLNGILLRMSFPTLPTTLAIFVAFIPLLLIEDEIAKSKKGTARGEVFRYSFVAFAIWNILTTYWVVNTAFAAGIVAIFLNAVFMTIPFLLFHTTKKALNDKLGYGSFIVYWISFEYIYLNQELSWTWLNIGNCFAEYPSWVQWYEYTGVFGGALWALVSNVLGFFIVKKYLQNKEWDLRGSLQWGTWIIVPLVVSLVMYFNYEEKGIPKEVVVIQPNFEPHFVKFNLSKQEQMQIYAGLSKEALTDTTEYLVFPESVFSGVDFHNMDGHPFVRRFRTFINDYPRLKLITGIGTYRFLKEGETHRAARERKRSNSITYWVSGNSAIQITAGQKKIDQYYKSKLVPGGEILPHREVFFMFKPLVDYLGGSMAGYETQPNREAFKSMDGTGIAPVICYESVYGEYTTGYVRDGANALFVVTNDGWWDDTEGHRQHLMYASLRAIETRRSVARSANTGTSGFINQRGDILDVSNYNEPVALRNTMLFNDEITYYTQMGDMIARLAGLLAILLLINTFVKGRMNKNA